MINSSKYYHNRSKEGGENMKQLNPNTIGLIVGSFVGFMHLLWALLVMLGLAQLILDFVYGIHFLNNPFSVTAFDITKAVILVVVTFIVGYVGGYVFTLIWNRVVKEKIAK